jgi:pyruvate/2-oxoglutarate dehydrogenase complex dihydrolipoamide acyltransferase (E2) component
MKTSIGEPIILEKITSILVKIGDAVETGQPLMKMA